MKPCETHEELKRSLFRIALAAIVLMILLAMVVS